MYNVQNRMDNKSLLRLLAWGGRAGALQTFEIEMPALSRTGGRHTHLVLMQAGLKLTPELSAEVCRCPPSRIGSPPACCCACVFIERGR